jgi:hypothetical protein
MSEPTKVIVVSDEDLPIRTAVMLATLLGVPAVVDWEGEPHTVRSSQFVPPGQMYVFDTAALDLGAVL